MKYFLLVILCAWSAFGGDLSKDELAKRIKYHQNLYWKEGRREISDKAYDALVAKLRKLDPTNSLLKPSIEGDVKTAKKRVKHALEMRSLNKCYKRSDLLLWCTRTARAADELFLVQPKYDGVSVEFVNGRFSTRGDGRSGYDITAKSSLIRFPAGKPSTRVVGELMMSNAMFSRLLEVEPKYVSPRHAVVGMLAAKSIEFWVKHHIYFDLVTYHYVEEKMTGLELRSQWDRVVNRVRRVGYATDGFVVKVADGEYYAALGVTKKYPKGALAFKWAGERKVGRLIGVEWTLAEKGVVPVGLLEGIRLDGAMVKRVTLYNYGYIRVHGLKLGDGLEIERVGGTVPVIKSIQSCREGKAITVPKCPECGSQLRCEGDMLRCVNVQCVGKLVLAIHKELTRRKVVGFGIKTIRKIVCGLKIGSWDELVQKTPLELSSVKGISYRRGCDLTRQLKATN